MKTVAIIGTGLIGASFGLALRKCGFDGAILGVSSPKAISETYFQTSVQRRPCRFSIWMLLLPLGETTRRRTRSAPPD